MVVGEPPCPGTWFGIHVPVPQTIVHLSLFVAVAVSLAGRDAYLEMENGGRYEPRTLSTPLRVDTTNTQACVTQDDLANSYSLQAD